jgi:hypothetical protein
MAEPPAGPSPSRTARRELALGVAAVLLVSSVTWFGTGQEVVGIGQVVLGGALVAVGAVLYRRSQRG